MDQYPSDIYYVYAHVDPEDINGVVYVGHGKGSRAWMFNWGATSTNRSAEHNDWCRTQCAKGSHPANFVIIIEDRLLKTEAAQLEQEYIRQWSPMFNKPQGLSILKFTPEVQEQAIELRNEGLSYKEIGDVLGLSTMTIYRGLTGETKNVK